MKIIVGDFETYFDQKTYTLSRMTTEEYVRDRRFEALCFSVVSGGKGVTIPQEHLQSFFDKYDWSDTAIVFHHAQFDGLILSHHYGIKPKLIFDTISMARILYGPHQRVSLAKLLEKFGMAPKTINYNEQSGKRWHEMGDHTRRMMLDGALHDSIQTEKLFYKMLPHVPKGELALIDRTVRMFTEPQFEGDIWKLREVINGEVNRKEDMRVQLRVDKKDLQSAVKFAALLEAEGVEVEYKEGKPGKNGKVNRSPCFAKTDPFMEELLNHENERVQVLAEARLDAKSTLNESRSGRLLRMAERGAMCVYIHHAGTHTLRPAGGDSTNYINMPRGGELRKSHMAAEGCKISVVDFKQFELRIALWLAGMQDELMAMHNGFDIYCDMASALYGRDITKADERERYVGKQTVLMSIYGGGEGKFHRELNNKHKVPVSVEEAESAIHVFRKVKYVPITKLWKELKGLIPFIAAGENFKWKCFEFRDMKAYAPNGSFMFFDHLEFREVENEWFMEKKPGRWEKMYGAKLLENLVQFLQRCMAADILCRIPRRIPLALWAYDEFVHMVRQETAEEDHEFIKREMRLGAQWDGLENLPVDVEGGLYDRYEK